MKKILLRVFFLTIGMYTLLLFTSSLTTHAAIWHRYNPSLLGVARDQRILKYAGANWGQYEGYDQKRYFKDSNTTCYRYDARKRLMIIRYVNHDKRLKVNYNYRKLVFRHGQKTPIIAYYYRLGHQAFAYLYTIKFWMIHPIRF